MKRVLVPVADGTEDIELSCITDVLVRGGVDVMVASVMPEKRRLVTLARKLQLQASIHISDVTAEGLDGILLPGGMPGSSHLAADASLRTVALELHQRNKLVGAICAAPAVVLGPWGLLQGVTQATCFPAMKSKLPSGTTWVNERVVLHRNILTSQGPGTAIEFALSALAVLVNPAAAAEVAKGLVVEAPAIVARARL